MASSPCVAGTAVARTGPPGRLIAQSAHHLPSARGIFGRHLARSVQLSTGPLLPMWFSTRIGHLSGKREPRVFAARADQPESPRVGGLPGDAADERPALLLRGEREHVVGERPIARDFLDLALGVDSPGE